MPNTINLPENELYNRLDELHIEFEELRKDIDSPDDNVRLQARITLFGLINRLKTIKPDLFDIVSVPNLAIFMQPISYTFDQPYPTSYLEDLELFFSVVLEKPVQPESKDLDEVGILADEEPLSPQSAQAVTPALVLETRNMVAKVVDDPKPALRAKIAKLVEQIPKQYADLYFRNRDTLTYTESKLKKAITDLEFLVVFSGKYPEMILNSSDLPSEYQDDYRTALAKELTKISKEESTVVNNSFIQIMERMLEVLLFSKYENEILEVEIIDDSFKVRNNLALTRSRNREIARFAGVFGLDVVIPTESKIMPVVPDLVEIFRDKFSTALKKIGIRKGNSDLLTPIDCTNFYNRFKTNPSTYPILKQILEVEDYKQYESAVIKLFALIKDLKRQMSKSLSGTQ